MDVQRLLTSCIPRNYKSCYIVNDHDDDKDSSSIQLIAIVFDNN
jgi:hypothetical protein